MYLYLIFYLFKECVEVPDYKKSVQRYAECNFHSKFLNSCFAKKILETRKFRLVRIVRQFCIFKKNIVQIKNLFSNREAYKLIMALLTINKFTIYYQLKSN